MISSCWEVPRERCISCFTFSNILFTRSLAGFVSRVPLNLRTLKPRKSKPSSIWVINVFSSDRVSPLSARNDATNGLTFCSSSSFDSPVIMKSSANLTSLTFGQYQPVEPFFDSQGKLSSSSFCNPSSAILASVGDMIPPCGVPSSVGKTSFSKIYPHLSHFPSMVLSIGMCFISQSWLMWSKHPLMSPSRIHCGEYLFERRVWQRAIASAVPLSFLKPKE
ncbi:hypothetical protein IMSAGC006_02135 [Muribaculaceae bacterium]|nr:hypothetical protein IMSAGC006_02135 [Muribaculaceae bacterium]